MASRSRVTALLFNLWGTPTVDLFVTRLNKVEVFYSCFPGPLALLGTFPQSDWPRDLLYMYLPCPRSLALHMVIRLEVQVIGILL